MSPHSMSVVEAYCRWALLLVCMHESAFTVTSAEQYHWLRNFMLEHAEAKEILGAVD
jgi:hypothetical protein